jgi:hypothetical protein
MSVLLHNWLVQDIPAKRQKASANLGPGNETVQEQLVSKIILNCPTRNNLDCIQKQVCDWCIHKVRPNECKISNTDGGKRLACDVCHKARRKCSLVAAAKAKRSSSATPSRRSSKSQAPRTPSRSRSRSTRKDKESSAGPPSRSVSRAAQSRVTNSMCESHFIFNYLPFQLLRFSITRNYYTRVQDFNQCPRISGGPTFSPPNC